MPLFILAGSEGICVIWTAGSEGICVLWTHSSVFILYYKSILFPENCVSTNCQNLRDNYMYVENAYKKSLPRYQKGGQKL